MFFLFSTYYMHVTAQNILQASSLTNSSIQLDNIAKKYFLSVIQILGNITQLSTASRSIYTCLKGGKTQLLNAL